jgi:dinuclear metal center YbgI/SA1388 family protein
MKLKDVVTVLEQMAPLAYAEDWDNVGLLAGDPQQRVKRVLLTIDLTAAVLAEAQKFQADLVLAYHPPIWDALKRVVAGQGASPLLHEIIRSNIAVYSFHTALDSAPGGVNDMLAEVVGIVDPQPLRVPEARESKTCKLVVFVPEDNLEQVSEAVFAAGAGHIGAMGQYSRCSFRGAGTGTFQCGPGTNPTIGKPGSFEQVPEVRFETVVAKRDLPAVLTAMQAAHCYEEPAFDILPMLEMAENEDARVGLGRYGRVKPAVTVPQMIDRIKTALKVPVAGVIGPKRGTVHRAAVGAGSCGSLLREVIQQECDFYLTGELRHHDALQLQAAGITTVCVSHSNSERPILKTLSGRLRKQCPELACKTARTDRDPFTWI